MLKRLTVAVAALFALASQALAAGTIPFSLSQQLDEFGKPLAGCKLYLIQAGTVSTPQNGYQDSALTLPAPNPLTCDASGRLPQFFLADGSIKVRLTKSNGFTVVTADGIVVVGASSGGGGGSPVDPTTVLATGDLKARYGTGVLAGFVRANGRTIGSASSGATERANADTQALFGYLWNTDPNLSVSGGRGVSSSADWSANKTIAMPNSSGRLMAFLDDMGAGPANVINSATCASPTTLGASCGSQTNVIQTPNLPAYTPSGHNDSSSVSIANQSSGAFTLIGSGHNYIPNFSAGGGTVDIATLSGTAAAQAFHGDAQGGSSVPLPILPPIMLFTLYLKL